MLSFVKDNKYYKGVRKMAKRKSLVYLLILTLAFNLVFTGCQSKKPVEQKKQEPVTVEFSYPPYGYDSSKEDAFWKKHIAEFEKENPNIKINLTIESWDNVYTKWEQMLESGNTADIGYDCPLVVGEYALQGKLLPLTDVVKNLGGEEAFTPSMKYFKTDGQWYGVPHGDASMVLLYRKDILKAAGFNEPPKTWDELIKIAKATTKNGTYGLGIFTGDDYQSCQIITGFMKAAGGKMLDKDKKLVLDSPENLKALEYMNNLANVYKVVPPSAVNWGHDDPANAVGLGKVAMAITWGGFGTLLEGMFPKDYQNIGFVKQPDGPGGNSGSWSGTGGFFMFKNAKHPEEAKKFIEYMSKAELSKEWATISGNVSPFVSVVNDPELTKFEWYRAMQEQSETQIHMGWDYGIVPGAYNSDPHFTKAVVDMTVHHKAPAQVLKQLQIDVQKTLDESNKK